MIEPAHDAAPGQDGPPAMPTWVKVLGIALSVLVLLILAKALLGGGSAGHGPGMHGG
jgi:hypothetical protein